MKLSIIVPVYNMEAYLAKCLQSLVSQTLNEKDYEILVIDDGSSDTSAQIIRTFAQMHLNLTGFTKNNGGLSDARNFGLQRASGEYIAFVDSDDYVDPVMYEKLLSKTAEYPFDMVVCDFMEVYPQEKRRGNSLISEDIIGKEAVRKAMRNIYPSAWNKIYRKELFDRVRFKKDVWFEDVECLYHLLPQVESIGSIHEPLYFYLQRPGSISKSVDPRIYHCLQNWNGILDFYKSHSLFPEYEKEIEYCYVRYLYATFVKAAAKYDHKDFRTAVAAARKNVKAHFPGYRRNSYFFGSAKGLYLILFSSLLAELVYHLNHKYGDEYER